MVVEDNLQGLALSPANAGSVQFANALPPGKDSDSDEAPKPNDRVFPIDQPARPPAREKRSLAHAGFGAQ
jgi:hypothetical protein